MNFNTSESVLNPKMMHIGVSQRFRVAPQNISRISDFYNFQKNSPNVPYFLCENGGFIISFFSIFVIKFVASEPR